jgi:hypothetical protein
MSPFVGLTGLWYTSEVLLDCDLREDTGPSSGKESIALKVLPVARFRPLLTVTDEGMGCPRAEPLLGDAFGGVLTGAGSLDMLVWTRSSSFFILPCKLRNCIIEPECGSPEPRCDTAGGLDMLCLNTDDGAPRLVACTEEPLAWPVIREL